MGVGGQGGTSFTHDYKITAASSLVPGTIFRTSCGLKGKIVIVTRIAGANAGVGFVGAALERKA